MHSSEKSVPPVRVFRFLMNDDLLSAAEESFIPLIGGVNYEYDGKRRL